MRTLAIRYRVSLFPKMWNTITIIIHVNSIFQLIRGRGNVYGKYRTLI